MKFRFRLETVMRQRKIEQDLAQRDFSIAQAVLNEHMALIKKMYTELDQARKRSASRQAAGGQASGELQATDDYIEGQKRRIELARQKARELMAIAEEKHEILIARAKDFKVLERLKEKQKAEARKEHKKKEIKLTDDLTSTRYAREGEQ